MNFSYFLLIPYTVYFCHVQLIYDFIYEAKIPYKLIVYYLV